MTPTTFAAHLAASSPLPTMTATASGPLRSALSPAPYPPQPSKTGRSPFFTTFPDLMRHSQSNSSSAPHPPTLLVGFDSPSTAAGLGALGGLNIAGLNGTPTASGMGMGMGMSMGMGIGIGAVAASTVHARDAEDESRRRIDAIVALLRQRPGLVSEEGVERLAKRMGLECLWEDGPGAEGEGGRTLSIAGNNVLVDVEFRNGDRVAAVGLSFPTCRMAAAERGAAVLRRDLQVGREEGGNKKLEAFADNLERLARLDKLSAEGVNCFEAVAGVFGGLMRVFEGEERGVGEGEGGRGEGVGREVMCKRGGRPRMHARGRIGLSVEYWMERRLVPGGGIRGTGSDGGMNGGKEPANNVSEEDEGQETKFWSAVVECEASRSELYPSIRVTDGWVSDEVDRSYENRNESFLTGDSALGWQDPPPTLTPSNPTGDAMEVDSSAASEGKPPDVRFIARLEPPLVVPLQTAVDIYGSVGVTIPQDSIRPTTFEELLLPSLSLGPSVGHTEDGQLVMEKQATAYAKEGVAIERKHKNTLYVQKSEYGRLIKDIPFSHPRQLVAILPVLRQWALVGSILQRSFGADGADKTSNSVDPSPDPPELNLSTTTNGRDAAEELAALMADADVDVPDSNTPMPVDFTLTTLPTPRIAVLFNLRGALATATFEILPNAEIRASDVTCNAHTQGATSLEGASGDVGPTVLMGAEAAAKALSISEDVGVVVEWVRMKSA